MNLFSTYSLGSRLAGVAIIFSLLTIGLTAANYITLLSLENMPAAMNMVGLGRTYAAELSLAVNRIADDDASDRARSIRQLPVLTGDIEERFDILLNGLPGSGIQPLTDPSTINIIRDNRDSWERNIKPALDDFLENVSGADARGRARTLNDAISKLGENIEAGTIEMQAQLSNDIENSRLLQFVYMVVVLIIIGFVAWILTGVIRTIQETTTTLASTSSELLAGTSQQASSAKEQAAAVAQTVSTVDEVLQTSQQAAARAREVEESAHRASEIGTSGRQAVEQSMAQMTIVQQQTGSIAENILALAERAQAIGDIISAVNDIAEQTNLLALNAGIEAARAGDHGAGFAVVAREIKSLADQAKQETTRVRQILSEIQKATNAAVMVTEEGGKSVDSTIKAVNQAGETIHKLVETVDDAATAASQITASTQQQTIGMNQIQQAMQNISEATHQATAASGQAERAAKDLNALGLKLKLLLGA